jgi:tRNA threonylcarbamoyladenosine biosynthesis protein TsaE
MVIHTSKSPEETLAYGESLGRSVQPGMVIGLVGDLGAGKTQFVRGFARGLDFPGRVHSPTFTLVNEYGGGRLPCFHLDLYRLDTSAQIASAGLEPYFNPEAAVTVVEWFDRARDHIKMTDNLRIITFSLTSDYERIISYDDPRT